MGKEEKFANIFDAASGKSKKKQAPEAQVALPAAASMKPGSLEDQKKQLEKCLERAAEIKKKIEDAHARYKISPRDIEKFVEKPQNFSNRDWNEIRRTKEEIEKKLAVLVPKRNPPESPPREPPSSGPPPAGSTPPVSTTPGPVK